LITFGFSLIVNPYVDHVNKVFNFGITSNALCLSTRLSHKETANTVAHQNIST